MVKIVSDGLQCNRCGWKWIPRKRGEKPIQCPNPRCRSPYWDRPRKNKGRKNA